MRISPEYNVTVVAEFVSAKWSSRLAVICSTPSFSTVALIMVVPLGITASA